MAASRRLLILDACVLIDLSHVDRQVLTDICRSVDSVHVPRPLFEEVDRIDEATAASIGLSLLEPDLADLMDAAREPSGALSFLDKLGLLLAHRHGWTGVSNDQPLRQECTTRGVRVLGGLEMLALGASKVASADLAAAAWAIHSKNARYVPKTIVEAFVAKLGR